MLSACARSPARSFIPAHSALNYSLRLVYRPCRATLDHTELFHRHQPKSTANVSALFQFDMNNCGRMEPLLRVSEISVHNLDICNSTAFSVGGGGTDCRAVNSLVFMAQLKISALKQAIIAPLTLQLSVLPSTTLLLYEMSPLLLLPLLTLLHFITPLFSSSPPTVSAPLLTLSVLWEPLRKSFAAVVFYSTGVFSPARSGWFAELFLTALF